MKSNQQRPHFYRQGNFWVGVTLILLNGFFIFDNHFRIDLYFWAYLLVAIAGVAYIISAFIGRR